MFSILENSIEDIEEDAILEGISKDITEFEIDFNEGKAIPEELFSQKVSIYIEEDALRGNMTDHLTFDELLCSTLSPKSVQLFNTLGINNIQYVAADIIDQFSNIQEVRLAKLRDKKVDYQIKILENYSIINVLSLIDCVDHSSSDVDYFFEPTIDVNDLSEEMKAQLNETQDFEIDFVRELVLDESKIPEDIKIFRLKDCPRILVFKEEVVKAIREAELTGFVFVPLSEYTDAIPDDEDEVDDTENATAPEDSTPNNPSKKEEQAEVSPKPRKKIIIKRRN